MEQAHGMEQAHEMEQARRTGSPRMHSKRSMKHAKMYSTKHSLGIENTAHSARTPQTLRPTTGRREPASAAQARGLGRGLAGKPVHKLFWRAF